jgi:hypothetical protein
MTLILSVVYTFYNISVLHGDSMLKWLLFLDNDSA